ncbi:hypothetical protein [Mesorhizobium sp.]|jgi:hypothetical protein|uniref:hypothetical protein n=1 Tax=Mesorhizobium sp. TaxID=1871066 RepID=UPI0025BBB6B3|nr:hypothetical protein [Mesorhizobium sp.]
MASSTSFGANSARPAGGELFGVLFFCFPSTLFVLHANADLTFGFVSFSNRPAVISLAIHSEN